MLKIKKIRFFKQLGEQDCGLACLRMIVRYYGKSITIADLKELVELKENGATFLDIINAGRKIGLESLAIKVFPNENDKNFPVLSELPLPFIAHWDNTHYVIAYKLSDKRIWLVDPKHGKTTLSLEEFNRHFLNGNGYGNIILLEPNENFYDSSNPYLKKIKFDNTIIKLLRLLFDYKIKIFPLFLCLLFSQSLNVITPFITQKLFDGGIVNQNINLLKKLLLIQIVVYAFSSILGYFNGVLNNKFSQAINARFIESFMHKAFKLPLIYFSGKKVSHFLQIIADYTKIETFFTYSLSNNVISLISVIVYSALLWYYNAISFCIVFLFSCLYYCFYITAFKKRRTINFERFDIQTNIQGQLIEIVEGIQEIKLGNTSQKKFNQWVDTQKRHYKNLLKNINLSQFQIIGSGLLNKLCYIVVTFYTALLTINGKISLGEMAAMQLIVMQLGAPILSIFNSFTTIQDTGFSLERIEDIKKLKEEVTGTINSLPSDASINLNNVTFSFGKTEVIKNLNLKIEAGKVTAIVGVSGSGKTTLLKLILGLYQPAHGTVLLEKTDFRALNQQKWRQKCGAVLQDSYLFTDSVINNVTDFDEQADFEKYIHALKLAAIYDFIVSLPNTHETIIGKGGLGLSAGQKQRIMIAKAIYKNPDYLFLDEATNAVDTTNERIIMSNLNNFFRDKTVVIVAHRLSTVRNADKIIVLHQGRIVEEGSHQSLVNQKGYYYELVKNQLELAS